MQANATRTSGPAAELTAFQRDLLTVLADAGTPSGLELKTQLERAWDTDEINHGRLYPNLDELVDRGLIEKGQHDRRTNAYSLTEQGRELLTEDLAWRTTLIKSETDDA